MRKGILPASLLAAVALLAAAIPSAASGLITRGDAQAQLEADITGGSAIRANAPQANGAPAERGVRIGLGANGHHYCADDWHVIAVADVIGGDPQQAALILEQDVFTINVDGGPLDLTVTPVKSVSQPELFGDVRDSYVQAGAVVSPTQLEAGAHTVEFMLVSPSGTLDHAITIFVDPSGTGACLL